MTRSNSKKIAIAFSMLLVVFAANAQFSTGSSQFSLPAAGLPQTMASWDVAKTYSAWAISNYQNQNSFRRIGAYKVKGTPYLYGAAYKADVYTNTQVGANVIVAYDTYDQHLEVFDKGNKQSITKDGTEIDSFYLRADSNTLFKEDLFFVNSKLFAPSTKSIFLQEVAKGSKYSLYKAYRSDLGMVSENYVQSELRQFDLKIDFYYVDNTTKKFTKLKTTLKALKSEFKGVVVDDFVSSEGLNSNPEDELHKFFMLLNL